MLDGYSNAKGRKGHAYSQMGVFLSLSRTSQVIVLVVTMLAVYGSLSLFAGGAPSATTNTPAAAAVAGDATAAAAAAAAAAGGDQTALVQQLQRQLQALENENKRLKKKAEGAGAAVASTSTALVSATPNGPSAAEGRGAPLGPYNWEVQRMEPESTERRFWIKTATNEEGHHFYRRILVSNGWIETADPKHKHCYFQFYGRFVPNINSDFPMFEEGKNMINHIPGEFAVLNKEPFLHLMRENSKEAGCDYTLIHPESYLIHLQQDCEDMFALGDRPANTFITSTETEKQRDNQYWFWKPPFNSFGRGIKVNSLAKLRENLGFGDELRALPNAAELVKERCANIAQNLTDTKAKLLVQRAIDHPYLIKGTKFDFRAYILIANTKPWQVYFKFGHVRRCLRPFDIESPVKKAHVCNDYSDELENDDFPLDDHIWPYDKFKAYLVGVGYTANDVDRAFNHNLKRLFLSTFRRFKDAMPQKNGYWMLLGIDVAIDKDWNSRVLEINTNPSMHYGTKIWGSGPVERNYKQMSEQLELVFDAHLKSKRTPLQVSDLVMKTKYGFELLYSEYTQPAWAYSNEQCFTQDPQVVHPPNLP